MNLFDRFARVVKSYANTLISTFEDPKKILEQTVLEMNDDLTKMRQATAQVLASQKRMENKYKAAEQASEDWYSKSQLALQKGEDDLAREALKRRKSFADNDNTLKSQLDQQKAVIDNLMSNTRLLESKIQEARSKKDTFKARAQSAKTATKMSEMEWETKEKAGSKSNKGNHFQLLHPIIDELAKKMPTLSSCMFPF
ncbi:hypothetical protein ACFX13_020532 [Malus domestica]|uniref:membrane-associated protein VIPP1, chloroplastic n=1 Tax=Malus domestica TaxID=3750 RepID=UPI0010A9E1E7|nr:membrane-associated 30 kDa protein, chloroplastic [Malus domestica]